MIKYILLRIAIIGAIIMSAPTFIFTVFYFFIKRKRKDIPKYYYDVAFSIDQSLNVWMQVPLNRFMINQKYLHLAHKFGNRDETMSHCIGKNNKISNDLNLPIESKLNIFFGRVLNIVDKNHIQNAEKTNQNNINEQ